MIGEIIENGTIAWLVLGFLVVEWAVLSFHHRRTGRGIRPLVLASTLAAGAGLWIALGLGLSGAGWQPIAGALAFALVAHLVDLGLRWRRD